MESFRAAVCLFELYGERITALQRSMGELPNPQPPIRVEAITAAEAQRAVVNSLQRELPRFYSAAAVQVTSCDQAINYTQLDLAGHDYSYAARCEVKIDGQEASVLMCDDALVGKWHIARDPGGMGRDQLAEFVRDNCPPGG